VVLEHILTPATMPCGHIGEIVERDDNGNRVRTVEICHECLHGYYTVEAKRLGDDGKPFWGPVGAKLYGAPRKLSKVDIRIISGRLTRASPYR
jgi:hypothetical protein